MQADTPRTRPGRQEAAILERLQARAPIEARKLGERPMWLDHAGSAASEAMRSQSLLWPRAQTHDRGHVIIAACLERKGVNCGALREPTCHDGT